MPMVENYDKEKSIYFVKTGLTSVGNGYWRIVHRR